MKKLVELMLDNLSTKEVFLFQTRCEECGREYKSKPLRFSKAGIMPQTQEKQIVYDAVYEQEIRGARHSAVRQLAEHFNYCPICKRLVCNGCFLICEDLDMCRDCATRLKQTGVPVLSEADTEVICSAGTE